MAVGLPAKASGAARFERPPTDVAMACASALQILRWGGQALTPYSFRVSRPMSFWSWGEEVQIDVTADSTVHVQSRCAFPIQWIDWGRNASNVGKFLTAVASVLAAAPSAKA